MEIPPKMQKRFGEGRMLIPKPLHIEALVGRVKRGRLITQDQLQERMGA